MERRDYRRLWVKTAFRGTVARALALVALSALLLSPIGWLWEPWGEVMNWLPSIIFVVVFAAAVVFGFISAPFLIYKELEGERDEFRGALQRADRFEGVLVELAQLRKQGVGRRNEMATQDVLTTEDHDELQNWEKDVIAKIREISPPQSELFETLDLSQRISLPPEIARHDALVHQSERLSRLKDFIDRYDAMLAGARGLGKRSE